MDCPHSEEDVKSALLNYYKDDCCFQEKSLDFLTILDITPHHAFRYALDTFIETRVLEERSEPYRNQIVDGPGNGPTPDKWQVAVFPPQQFVSKTKVSLELPHSGNVVGCHKCHSSGFTACSSCNGMGFSRFVEKNIY